jgi:hypothetical protein
MVLEAFGDRVPNLSLREKANKLLGVSSPRTGTRIEDLARIAAEHGLDVVGPDVVIGPKKDQRSYRRWTLDEARAEIRKGHPVLVQVWLPALPNQRANPVPTDHYIVLTGLAGSSFIYNDPADSHSVGYQQRMTEEQLKKAWSYSGAPYAAFSAAPGRTGKSLLPPPPEPALMADPGPASEPGPVPAAEQPPVVARPGEAEQPPVVALPAEVPNPKDQDSLLYTVGALPGYSPAPEPAAALAEPVAEAVAEARTPVAGRLPALPLTAGLVGAMALGAVLYTPRPRPARKRARKLVKL